MPLLAYNRTAGPVTLAAGHPAPVLPPSTDPPHYGPEENVTLALQPSLVVDPANGILGGLSSSEFTQLQAQVSSGTIAIEWTSDREYLTTGLVVGHRQDLFLNDRVLFPLPLDLFQGGVEIVEGILTRILNQLNAEAFTTANRPAPNDVTPGTVIFNLDTGSPEWSDGTAWVSAAAAAHAIDGAEHTGAAVGALAGTHGVPSATNKFVTDSDPRIGGGGGGDLHLYADGTAGNDGNDGLTALTPKKTLAAIWALVPVRLSTNLNLHLSGKFGAVPWNSTFRCELANDASLIVDGGDGLTVVYDDGGSPWSADISSLSSIGLSTLGWAVDAHLGWMVEITSGPAAGDIRTIRSNTATTLVPNKPFTVDPGAGAGFHIVRPTTEIEQLGTPGDAEQSAAGSFVISGDGWFSLQRLYVSGNMPLNLAGAANGVTKVFLSALVVDKSQAPLSGNLWRVAFVGHQGRYGFVCGALDPAVFGHAVRLAGNEAGVGTAGGDASVAAQDVVLERSLGIASMDGCVLQQLYLDSCPGVSLALAGYARAKSLVLLDSMTDMLTPAKDVSLGGFIPFGGVAPTLPGAYLWNSSLHLEDCDCWGSPLGLLLRGSHAWLSGTVSGINAVVGVKAVDQSRVGIDSGATVTLAGTALGDLTLDGAIPVPGGWAGILGGAAVTDPNTLSMAQIQAGFPAL